MDRDRGINSVARANTQICTGQIGQLLELNLKEDDFNAWLERFELYVALNEINIHKQQLLFLTLLGNEGYSLIRDLCTPQKPSEKKYEDLKQLLLNYMNPKPNHIIERYKFKERRQACNESIMQFVTNLKKMTEYCKFGTSLDDCLRDQVIWGIKDSNIKKRLLSEEKLTFKKCVELCVAMESANKDVIKLDHEEINYQGTSKKKRSQFYKKGEKESTAKPESKRTTCYCCGSVGHIKPFCKYKAYSCKNCSKVGHLKKVCKAKVKSVNNLEDDLMDLNLNTSLDRFVTLAKHNYEKSMMNARRNYRGNRVRQYEVGNYVMYRNYGIGNKWLHGIILKKLTPVIYLIKTYGDKICKRHINQLIDSKVKKDSVREENKDILNELSNQMENKSAEKENETELSEINGKGTQEQNDLKEEEAVELDKEVELGEQESKEIAGDIIRRSKRIRRAPKRLDL